MDQIRGVGGNGQPYRGPGWYIVPNQHGFPLSQRCVCGDHVDHGEIVWCVQYEMTKVRRTFVFHKGCMEQTLDNAPIDNYESIRERVGAGGPLWTE